ncbi:hypothetical protein HHK36_030058 [Tetracentron sinense]|uniref:Uncharacterized protein n=1 Tax=Tetracentron sinense TaxID=13715 RepID=A0A834YEJ4_TETSI|nr:hypothetical protein HHK36_030058 [Tetracentron sinense]
MHGECCVTLAAVANRSRRKAIGETSEPWHEFSSQKREHLSDGKVVFSSPLFVCQVTLLALFLQSSGLEDFQDMTKQATPARKSAAANESSGETCSAITLAPQTDQIIRTLTRLLTPRKEASEAVSTLPLYHPRCAHHCPATISVLCRSDRGLFGQANSHTPRFKITDKITQPHYAGCLPTQDRLVQEHSDIVWPQEVSRQSLVAGSGGSTQHSDTGSDGLVSNRAFCTSATWSSPSRFWFESLDLDIIGGGIKMKFGKEFKEQMVPEWKEAYMDYDDLKRILKEIMLFKNSKQPETSQRASHQRMSMYRTFSGLTRKNSNLKNPMEDVEDQVIAVNAVQREGFKAYYKTKFLMSSDVGENEIMFFRRLDDELNKVNTFYKVKMDEVINEAASMDKQMDSLIALRIKVNNPDFNGFSIMTSLATDIATTTTSRVSTPTSTRMPGKEHMDLIPEMEMTTKSQVEESTGGEVVSPTNTINCSSGICDEKANTYDSKPDPLDILEHVKINNTLETPKSTTKGILKDSKEEELSYGKEELRTVEPQLKLVFVEFYQKLLLLKHYSFMNLLAFSKIMKKYEKITSRSASRSYLKIVDNSYLGSSDEVTTLLMRVETTFIKHFSNSNHRKGMKSLRPKAKRENHSVTFFSGFFSGCSVALLVALGMLIQARDLMNKEESTQYMENIFPLYRQPRTSLKLIETLKSGLVSHLHFLPSQVTLPDFFLADQLTSQVLAIRNLEYYICYYGWGDFSRKQNKCHIGGVYNTFYFIVAVFPYWARFLQCLRRLFEEKDAMHGYNGLKYFLTVMAVVMRTASDLKKGTTWKVMAIVSSAIATIMNTYWDIVVDWGLLQRHSKNRWLRDMLLVSNASVYFAAMLVLEFHVPILHPKALVAIVSCLEIIRRGIWNFFRLENEHLNNVGKFRAFKSVPLPFTYYDDDKDKDD